MDYIRKKLNKVYVLHENGAPTHYLGLKAYLEEHGVKLSFIEFSILKKIIKSIFTLNIDLLLKQLINLTWLISCIFSKNKVVVFGIAPLDWRIIYLKSILKRHTIYYHTSWPYWDGSKTPKTNFLNLKIVRLAWIDFIKNTIQGIFTVTETAKESLKTNFDINVPIYVVYHSIFKYEKFSSHKNKQKKISLLFVGRLVYEKGIAEIQKLFNELDTNKFDLNIVGDGELSEVITSWAKNKTNVRYHGAINNKEGLNKIYQKSDILLLPSKKTKKWEELFGMVIIEAMSYGVIPFVTNHVGPSEIIINGINGILFNDDENIVSNLKYRLTNLEEKELSHLSTNAINSSAVYEINSIKQKWAESRLIERLG